jgi:anti-sigma-K factor RskA
MAMTFNDIKNSGLLELYVLGDLTTSQKSEVEAALKVYPELRAELKEIENALFQYSKFTKRSAPESILDNVLKSISDKPNSNNLDKPGSNLAWLLGILTVTSLIASTYFYNKYSSSQQTLLQERIECDQLKQAQEAKNNLLATLSDPENLIIEINPTEKFPETQLYLFTNKGQKKNLIQVQNLPDLADNQSFQLWSLKDGIDPIPMDVFEIDGSQFIEVDFEENTNAYAITIEDKGGAQSPNLDMLIGVFSLAG